MNERIIQLRRAAKVVLFVLLLSIAGMTKAQTENITFADAIVKAYCVANWDTDGDGELNQAEAAAVTSLDGVFMFDGDITSFNELQFFTSLTSFGEDEFNSCTSLATITIPNSVTSIGNYAFSDCSSLTLMTSYACTPPALGNDVFYNVPSAVVLNVPCHTPALYQAADGWNDFSNYEEFEYGLCPIPFADDNVKAICVAHWDTNEDGELSYGEAAAVTNLGTYFKSTAITAFDELEYFTSLTSLPNTAFYGCTSLASIAIPASVSALGNGSFYNCTSLATMTVYAETPPTVGTNAFKNVPTSMVVNVPCGTIEAYQNANGWSGFTNIQQSGACPIVFADANVKALCVTNWDTNGDGELSYVEAAAVTDLGEVFKNKNNITGFDELQYFTGLSSVGYQAFYQCSGLTSIIIPNSVTSIGGYAFGYCTDLTSIEIPNSVISLVSTAFNYCSGLEQIEVASDNAYYDSRENSNAIILTNNNTLVAGCKNTVIPNSVTSIGSRAFYGCIGLTSIEIPNSVTSIGGLAFGHCSGLVSIIIPNSVSYIGLTQPFDGCSSLEQIIVDSGNQVYDSRENCNAIIKTSTNELITGCKNTLIPNTTVVIGGFAFDYCTGLTSIEIPNSVISINGSAFYYCTGLTSIELSNSLTSIGNFAFSGCTGLTSVELPNSLTSIGDHAFSGCTGLTSVEFPNSLTSIGPSAFYYCTGLTSIELSNSLTTIGNSAFSSCTGLTSVVLPNSLTSIGNYAFSICTSLTSMTVLANNPPALGGDYVFYNVNKSIPVYVPCTSMLAYQDASGWNEFTNYLPVSECEPGEITATANPAEGGVVSGSGFYEGGAICTLTAAANTGYAFVDWTKDGEVVSNSNIYSFNVAGDASFVANFIEIPPAPVIAEYYPEPNEPNCPNVKVNWTPVSSEAQIGEGTLTFGYFPFYTYYNYSIAENLYLAFELEEVGFTSSPMTSLSWYATYAPGYAQQGISIWMANVSDTELTTTSHTVSGMTLVYTGAMTPEIGWNEFVFNEGTFVWDGVSNVLIYCQRNNGAWNSTVNWQAGNVGFNASSYNYTDYYPYNANETNTMYISTTRPNIIMKGEGGISYNLYRANCDGSDAQLIAENLNDTQYIDETWWQLENNSYKYGVSVADSTNTDIFWSNCIEKQGDVAVQTITLSSGTNWFSTYVEITLDDLKAALETATPNTAITVQSQTQNTSYNPNNHRWTGRLTALDLSKMYKITVAASCEITLSGMLINPANHPVTISTGSNWIAFPIDENMTPTEAFAGFAVNGDVLQSQTNNANYRNNRWVGQVNTLEPGKGYIYRSSESDDRIFVFPQGRANQGLPSGLR